MKRIISAFLCFLILISVFSIAAVADENAQNVENTVADGEESIMDQIRGISYSEYLRRHSDKKRGTGEFVINASHLTEKSDDVEILSNHEGFEGDVLKTTDDSKITFEIDIPEGMYTIKMDYYTVSGRNIPIQREIIINGKNPFSQSNNIILNRLWRDVPYWETNDKVEKTDAYHFRRDYFGNDLRPEQREIFGWMSMYFMDSLAYYSEPLEFYFKEGKNIITLVSKKEPLIFGKITLAPAKDLPEYSEFKKSYTEKGYKEYSGENRVIEAELPSSKSDSTLYPYPDNSTASTQPYTRNEMRINAIGGVRWQYPLQSITWTARVEESGLYKLTFKARKNIYQSMVSARKLYINGEIQFEEAKEVVFNFSNSWVNYEVKDKNGEACLFYLEAGKDNLITLETSLGQMGPILEQIQGVMSELNDIYRQIITITGSATNIYGNLEFDVNRDYMLGVLLPDIFGKDGKPGELEIQYKLLEKQINAIMKYTGQSSGELSVLYSAVRHAKALYENPDNIATSLSFFKSSIGSMGTWIYQAENVPLELDQITLSAPDESAAKPTVGFWEGLMFAIRQFIASFIIDYNAIGKMSADVNKAETPRVWIASGRDQFQTLRSMINNMYTQHTNNEVSLELVNMGALTPAIISGIGPDVALGIAQNEPVNYAMRNAVMPLDGMPGFDEVAQRFLSEAFVPFRYGGKTYALPETQTFNVMFYRKDVLASLGLDYPKTWDDLILTITELNKNNLEFGLPQDLPTYNALLMQLGGRLYEEDGKSCLFNSNEAVSAFKKWTNLYVNLRLPLFFDFQNRFRTGEMPLGIADYTLYNQLSIAAPEIRGLWDFTLIPGTPTDDLENYPSGINNSNTLTVTSSIILSSTDKPEKSWEFLKWWTEKDSQSKFGSEIESILGPSARYNTANIEAFKSLPWKSGEIKMLEKQMLQSKGFPEVPGGYFITRHYANAFSRVLYTNADPRDTIVDYANIINAEIDKKRAEFGLSVKNK